jgi:hypothetical protein
LTSEGTENEGARNGAFWSYPRSPLQLTSEEQREWGREKWCVHYPLSPNGTQQAWAANGGNVGNGKVGELAIFKSAVPSTSAILWCNCSIVIGVLKWYGKISTIIQHTVGAGDITE